MPINVFAVYEVVDSRCNISIKESLRESASKFAYRLEKVKQDGNVTYNVELLNVDKTIYIINSSDNIKYYNNGIIKNIKAGKLLKLYIYASNETYCEGYKANTVSVQIPYYNKYSENPMCVGYENHALCNPNSDLNITTEEFETQMKSYIASLNNDSNNDNEKETENTNTTNKFDIMNFIIENSDYISGIGWILLVIYITATIGRLNKKRGIL